MQSEVEKCIELLNCAVILVDDGSTDRTLEMLNNLSLQFPTDIKVLPLPRNVGKGEAVRAGFNFAFELGATQVLFCDADFATGPQDLLRLCNTLDHGLQLLDQIFNARYSGIIRDECLQL